MATKTVCNLCGKEFDTWDTQEGFGFDYHVGYGSKFDYMHMQADFCCHCFDLILEGLIRECKISPVIGEYDDLGYETEIEVADLDI